MNKGRVGEDRGSKEMDGYPLTGILCQDFYAVLCCMSSLAQFHLRLLIKVNSCGVCHDDTHGSLH
jgi:hypothetical protein